MRIPAGACDSHIHIYGPAERYPVAPSSPFAPPLATADQYRAVMAMLGTDRVVLVQPGAYADDNRCLTDALEELGDCARGVATVLPGVSHDELNRLTKLGVCGTRALMFRGGILSMEQLPQLAETVSPVGWHLQLQLDGRELPRYESMLAALRVSVVIDHNGKFVEPVAPDHPGMRALLRLLDRGNFWVKASAPYETSKSGAPHYQDVGVIAKTIIEHAPHRVVWATNWPHGGVVGKKPDDRDLLAILESWAPDPIVRERILVDNARELYRF